MGKKTKITFAEIKKLSFGSNGGVKMTLDEVAKKLGTTPAAVWRVLRENLA